ncbi:MAG: hypothetical protein AAF665_11055 [Pseudomonadota bacterium]
MTVSGTPKPLPLYAALLCAVALPLHAETSIENSLDEINEHFAIASEHYGDGKVQLHTRSDGQAGSRHTVYTFNCKEQTFRSDYDGETAPERFPAGDFQEPSEPVTQGGSVAPMAQYACAEHGHPLLEWRW